MDYSDWEKDRKARAESRRLARALAKDRKERGPMTKAEAAGIYNRAIERVMAEQGVNYNEAKAHLDQTKPGLIRAYNDIMLDRERE